MAAALWGFTCLWLWSSGPPVWRFLSRMLHNSSSSRSRSPRVGPGAPGHVACWKDAEILIRVGAIQMEAQAAEADADGHLSCLIRQTRAWCLVPPLPHPHLPTWPALHHAPPSQRSLPNGWCIRTASRSAHLQKGRLMSPYQVMCYDYVRHV